MTIAIMMTIISAILWGASTHIDKFLINGVDESGSSIKTLLVFSTFIAGLVFSPIWLIICNFSISISAVSLTSILISAVIYILATYFYFIALDKNDASIVIVMFQMIPVFSYILALVFFKESLTIRQIIGALIIIFSAVIISYDFEEKNNKKKFKALVLMVFASILSAIYYILFDISIRNSQYNSCAFWFQISLLVIGIILLLFRNYRKTFINAIKNNGKVYLSLNILNELLNILAHLCVNFANVTIPIALANVSNGFQTIFVFILGALGTKILPKYFNENLSKKVVIQKVSCIILSIIGLIVMFY